MRIYPQTDFRRLGRRHISS